MKPPAKQAAGRRKAADAKGSVANERVRLTLAGEVPNGIAQLRSSTMSLVTLSGKLDDDTEVLVPLVDWQISGRKDQSGKLGDGDTGDTVASFLVAFDNMAFIVNRLGHDMRDAARLLVAQSRGGIAPRRERIDYIVDTLRGAAEQLQAAATELEAGAPPDAASGDDVW